MWAWARHLSFRQFSTHQSQKITGFWDVENCTLPSGIRLTSLYHKILSVLRNKGFTNLDLIGHGNFKLFHPSEGIRSPTGLWVVECEYGFVQLVDVKPVAGNEADSAVKEGISRYQLENRLSKDIILISGDHMIVESAEMLRQKGHTILLCGDEGSIAKEIFALGPEVFFWKDFLYADITIAVKSFQQSYEHLFKLEVQDSFSFEEETYQVEHLPSVQSDSFSDLLFLVQKAIKNNELGDGEISIWGIPLLRDDRTQVILLKFLRSRKFDVCESFRMLKNTFKWRKKWGIDELSVVDKQFEELVQKLISAKGFDKRYRPVWYIFYEELSKKEVYSRVYKSTRENTRAFYLSIIMKFEKSIRQLSFDPKDSCTLVFVHDLANAPLIFLFGKESRIALGLLHKNYPDFSCMQIFINTGEWFPQLHNLLIENLTERTVSKLIYVSYVKTGVTLLRYIAPDQLPMKYGGTMED